MKESVFDPLLRNIVSTLATAKELESRLGQIRQEMIDGIGPRASASASGLAPASLHPAYA